MRKGLLWAGVALLAIGVAVLGVSLVLVYLGSSPSINLGDPSKFQFVLVPFWQIGLAIAVLGAVCILVARQLRAA
jgi:hypothetical protein